MRKLMVVLLAVIMMAAGPAGQSLAAIKSQDLGNFLKTEGITKDQLVDHLEYFYDSSVTDFDTVKELDSFLGAKITTTNLNAILSEFGFANEKELVAFLVENGEMESNENIRSIFIYVNALKSTIEFYVGTPITDKNLQELLDENGITLEQLKEILKQNDDSLGNYDSIEDLEDTLYNYDLPINEATLNKFLEENGLTLEELKTILSDNNDSLDSYKYISELEEAISKYGTPITDNTLGNLLEEFELTRAELDSLLAKYGDSIDNYKTIDQLYMSVMIYSVLDDPSTFEDGLGIGLTQEETVKLVKHFMDINLSDPAMEDKWMDLASKVEAIGEFDSASDLTPQQLQALVSIYDEMMNLFQLNAKYFLVKDGVQTPISKQELLTLQDTNGSDLLIQLYDLKGNFLADILLTAEMFGSEIIEKVTEEVTKVEKVVNQKPQVKSATAKPKTVSGGKLPNTDGGYAERALAGAALLAIGIFIFRKRNARLL
ncbi:processed acidic surface protein [Mesobacillus zeae]|uniref:Processed acidic surface protein n=1 Tax=Mesobacillus zeae TaxID=1917180 RepID=A0A398AVP2_9BACI|nr:processed acidic surface protein [Mesobacillus zeae]RID81737.1 processed acidic surface protein [Mesobacillus zeae]